MTDLSAKFEALESQLTTQHNAVMAALSDIGASLDAIAIALEPADPPLPTLADVVAAIQAGNALAETSQGLLDNISNQSGYIATTVGDIHLDTMSMDEKLLTLRDTLSDVHLDTQSIDQKLLRIRDAINPLDQELPTEDNSSIPWLLYRIMDAINPTWPRLTSVPLQPAVDLLLALAQLQLPNLADIEAALGTPTGDASTTVLGYLSSLQYSNAALVTGQQQLIDCGCPDHAEGCTNPYISAGMWLAPFGLFQFESVMVATWPAPPDGLSYGSYFGIGEDYTELHSDDWTGWTVFVESDQPQYAADTGPLRYPTNVWQAVPPGAGNYAFSVDNRGAIKVTLCPPDVPPDPPFSGSGYAAGSMIVADTGSAVFTSQGETGLPLNAATIGGISPFPHNAIGETLYIYVCYNTTENADTKVSFSTIDDDPESIIFSVDVGETYTWTVADYPRLYLWSYGREPASGTGMLAVVAAWDAASAAAHCPE